MTQVTLSYSVVDPKSVKTMNVHRDWLDQWHGPGWSFATYNLNSKSDAVMDVIYDIADPGIAVMFKLIFGGQ